MTALPAINNLRTLLSVAMSNVDTTATVASTTGFPSAGIFTIEEEIIAYTGTSPTTFTGLTRGYDGTLAVAHSASPPLVVNLRITAKHLNDAAFINAAPTPVTIGGIPAGSTFPVRQTVQEMLDLILYPYQYPDVTAMAITGVPLTVEVGYTIPASITFTWSTSNSVNVQPNSIYILDQTGGDIVLAPALANDGTEAVIMGASIQKTVADSHIFRIDGMNTLLDIFDGTVIITWRWRLYYGVSGNATLTGVQIGALAGSLLASSYAGTFACGASGYKYICQANAAGGQLTSVKDQLTGFNVPMADVTDNAAYSNTDGGGFSYALVSHTNAQGITTNYRVYRTKNSLGGAVTLVVT